MRLVIQRVRSAAVSWTDAEVGEERRAIGRGLAILVGVGEASDETGSTHLASRVAGLRIFPDPEGRFNLSLTDVGGEALVVSQFTLYANLSRGRRPGFTAAGEPTRARALCDHFADQLRARGIPTQTGSFGAGMLVEIANEGPVTLVLSTDDWATRV